ncbi:MAG: hypothetical protein ACKOB9_07915 [Solirubrobacterales bacterium]
MRRHLTPSLVISMIALFVALGGASYAAIRIPKNSVGTSQLKKNAVNSTKVKDRSLLATDFKAGQLPRGEQGPKGDTGATGATGASGVTAANGASREGLGNGFGITLSHIFQTMMSTTVNSAPAGRIVVTGSVRMINNGPPQHGSSCYVEVDGVRISQNAPYYPLDGPAGGGNEWQLPVVGSAPVTAGTHTAEILCRQTLSIGAGTTVAYSGDLVAFVAAN